MWSYDISTKCSKFLKEKKKKIVKYFINFHITMDEIHKKFQFKNKLNIYFNCSGEYFLSVFDLSSSCSISAFVSESIKVLSSKSISMSIALSNIFLISSICLSSRPNSEPVLFNPKVNFGIFVPFVPCTLTQIYKLNGKKKNHKWKYLEPSSF